jgi:hypothetical protein
MNVISPINERPNTVPFAEQFSVNWDQETYFYIVKAIYQYVWGETLEGWHLNNMDFELTCNEIEIGLQNGRFEFFRDEITSQGESRITRFIDIDPRSNFINVTERVYFPKLVDWKSIDLTTMKNSAGVALHISETNGGEEKRLSIGNNCNISMWLNPDVARYRGWNILYTRNSDGAKIFRIQVDPITGKIHFP